MILFGSVDIKTLATKRHKIYKKLFLQQLFRVAASAVGDLCTCEHARELFNAAGIIEPANADLGSSLRRLFLHHEMTVSKARNLRLVRDAQHLIRLRELL